MSRLPRILRLITACLLGIVLTCAASLRAMAADNQASADSAAAVSFERDIKPIFAQHCIQCHGPDKADGGLRLTGREDALKELDSTQHAIVPGDPDASELLRRVSATVDEGRMPLQAEPLSAEQIGLLRSWIAQGAPWEVHWAYRPLSVASLPTVRDPSWVHNPIDAFVLARLEAEGVAPSPEADRYTLIKRLYYDLLGLVPAPDEVEAFVNDSSSDAYERLVDRLLASPRFGERWGRHWLDMARYADSDGYEKDNPRPDAWRYRDWVIDALNADMPFDQFTVEQLAGDLLPGATPMQRLATAFHRQTLTNTEGGADQEQFRVEALFDRVATTGTVWLGLTIGCAQCHNHKYDDIQQREFYQLFAFYNNGDESTATVNGTISQVAAYERAKTRHNAEVAALAAKIDARRTDLAPGLAAWEAQLQTRLAGEPTQPAEYHPLEDATIRAESGATFEQSADGSWLASGPIPETDKFVIEARTTVASITGFRLEALVDPSLPGMGPGRAANGNFVLNELRVLAGPSASLADEHRLELAGVEADFAQQDFASPKAADGDAVTGWAVAPEMGKEHWAVFRTRQPAGFEAGTWLRIELDQTHGTQHTLGRFRLLAATGVLPGAEPSSEIRTILAIAANARDTAQSDALLSYFARQDADFAGLEKQMAELVARAPTPPDIAVRVITQRSDQPRTTHILTRGDFLRPADPVEPGALGVLPPLKPRDAAVAPDRLDLARWLTDPENPLPPRVLANSLWARLFGAGLVRTPNDFGVRGEKPTHPQLLDWMAAQLVRQGWSRKAVIRQIVGSATYRQSSRHRTELEERDPQNYLLHRQNRVRVEAELVRDLALASSGLLATQIGGPSVFPPLPPGVAELSYANNFTWTTSEGSDRYRRGMYTFFKRTAPHPTLVMFDCPDSNKSCVERGTSNTPLQALTLLNNDVFVESAQALARRALAATCDGDLARLSMAFRLCAVRPPAQAELDELADLLHSARSYYASQPEEAAALVGTYAAPGAGPAELAAWIATARIMLNLDELITRE